MSIVDDLKRDEGAVLIAGRHRVYRDSLGLDTIGYGRLLSRGLSEDEALYLLENDIKDAEAQAAKYDWFHDLDEVRQAVVTEMLFNIGPDRFNGFALMKAALDRRDYVEAAHQMRASKWAEQVKGRATRLAAMMETGKWP